MFVARKPTDISWLGDIPGHWVVKAIKWCTRVQRGASPRPIDDPRYFDDDGRFGWVRIEDVTASSMYLKATTQRLSSLGSILSVRMAPGRFFLSIAGSVGKPCITAIECCIHDGFVYFPDWRGDPRFLYYAFASGQPYRGLGKLGTQLNLNTDTVGSIRLAIPPVDEQQTISAFLDRKTAAIDAIIAKKERLLELLQEKRQTLIARAVTKGLDLAVDMKDSGVEWLGEVPRPWKVVRLKHVVTRIVDCPHTTPECIDDGDFYVIRTADIDWGRLFLATARRVSNETYIERTARLVPQEGDVLYSREGERFGMAALVPKGVRLCLGQRMMMFRPAKTEVRGEYLNWFLNSRAAYNQVVLDTTGATAPRVNIPTVANLWVAVPPFEEQSRIAEVLTRFVAGLDRTVDAIATHVGQIREYRQALITAAVTGKIDVSIEAAEAA